MRSYKIVMTGQLPDDVTDESFLKGIERHVADQVASGAKAQAHVRLGYREYKFTPKGTPKGTPIDAPPPLVEEPTPPQPEPTSGALDAQGAAE